jgi:hypothetical protein
MKKFLLTLAIIGTISPAMALQTTFNGSPVNYGSSNSSQPIKVYDKYGSLQSVYKPQQNGSTRVYNKFGSYQGQYRQDGSRLKYYPKN